ncbi:MAG: hypothetical protein Q8M03_05190 [Legionella sp.]|nr:hypothetical protein [Legionella sp.]
MKVDSIDGNDPALCSSSAKVQVEWSSEQPISAIIIALETSTLENIFFEVIIDIIACLELEIYSSSSKKQLKGTVLSTGNQFSFRLVAVNSRKEQFTQLPAFECSFEPLIPMHYYLMKVDSDPVKDRNQIEQFEIQHFVIEGGQSLLFTPLTAGSVKISITLNESFKLAMNMSSPYFEALLIVRDELIFNPDLPTVVTSSVELPVHVIGGNRCVSLSNSLYTFSTSILQGEASALIDYNSGRVVFKQPGTIEFSARYYEGLWNSNETSIEPLAVSDPVHVVEPEYLKIRIVREFCFLYEDMELDDVQQIQTQEAAEPYLIEGRYYLIFVDIYDSHHRLVQQFGKDYRLSLRDFGDLFETKAQVNSWSVFTKAVGEGSLCAVLERVNHNPDGNIDEWSVVVTSLLNIKSAAPIKIRPGSYLAIPDLPSLPPVELLVAGGIGDESEKRYIMFTTPNCFVRFRVLYMDEKNIVHGSTKVTQMKWSENIKQYTNPANCAALIEDYYDRTNRDLVVFFPVSLRFIEFEGRGVQIGIKSIATFSS